MSEDLALDFGSAVTRVADDQGNLLFEEPTIAAVDTDTGRLVAFGSEVVQVGASAGRIVVTHPVRNGQIVDLGLAEEVLAETLARCGINRVARPRVLVGIHPNETNVQRRAIERALKKAGVRSVQFIEQPIAGAIGAGLDIAEPAGAMVVDFGAGTTDIGVMALGGLVAARSLRVGGDTIDDAIRSYLARVHGIVVELRIAEAIKRAIVVIDPAIDQQSVEVSGRAIATGSVLQVVVTSTELASIVSDVVAPIFDAAADCISAVPPDLANDLLDAGLVLGGGSAPLGGFDQRLARRTGVAVHVSDRAARSP